MQSLGIKKFFLDYLIGSGLIFLSLFLLLGDMTALNTRATVGLYEECSPAFPAKDVLQSLQRILHVGEHCEVVSPCVKLQSVRCEGTVPVSGLFKTFLKNDLLVFRIKESLMESFSITAYKDSSTFRFPLSFIFLLLFYGVVLMEAGAMAFALWRQNKLKQTFSLPDGLMKDQMFKPAFFAILLAVMVVLLNYLVFNLFDHPEMENREVWRALLESVPGIIAIVILAPLAEELMFRGVLLRFFVEKKKLLLGTVIVSLLFAGLHGFNEPGSGWQLYRSGMFFVVSVSLCWVYIKRKNIWSPIVFHSAYNSSMVIFYMIFV